MKHSANVNSTECLILCTRQSLGHSAYVLFPVVSEAAMVIIHEWDMYHTRIQYSKCSGALIKPLASAQFSTIILYM